jgi:hypothetical protein
MKTSRRVCASTELPLIVGHLLRAAADCHLSARMILKRYSDYMPEFEIALHTGMRPRGQYGLDWSRVDLTRNFVSLPKTKNGKTRHIRLNAVAVAPSKCCRSARSAERAKFLLV